MSRETSGETPAEKGIRLMREIAGGDPVSVELAKKEARKWHDEITNGVPPDLADAPPNAPPSHDAAVTPAMMRGAKSAEKHHRGVLGKNY